MMMVQSSVTCALIVIIGAGLAHSFGLKNSGTRLSKFIRHYEPLNYDHQDVHRQHHIVRRSVGDVVRLDMRAFGRDFKLRLKRDTRVFSPDLVIETSQGLMDYDVTRAYVGELEGEDSVVFGVLSSEGHFEGNIVAPEDTYMVQRTLHHFKDPPPDFHSVMYRVSDVEFDMKGQMCKSEELHKKLLERQRNMTKADAKGSEDWREKYIVDTHKIHKRAIDPAKTTCTLYMQAEHLYVDHYGGNTELVVEQMTNHVQAVNDIYRLIDFDGDGAADNIEFIIKRIMIYGLSDPDYKYPDNYGVETFLDLHSQDDYDAFCLSYIFTYRDFNDGVLGLAWTGDTTASGGVCERYTAFSSVSKSLNSGLLTIVNYAQKVANSISQITLTHEIGHNMGSNHDPDGTCTPGGTQGNYIMYARATSGDKPNNNKFSSCSIADMHPVMSLKARSTSNGCFIASSSEVCGNKIKEGAEECDCGWDDQCTESCCNPQATSPVGTPCTLKASAVCSPSQSLCCNSTCQPYPAAENHECRANDSCQAAAQCDGSSVDCPASTTEPDTTPCGTSQVCFNGECTGLLCPPYNMTSCQCAPATADDWTDASLCQVCCNDPADGLCKSSFDLADIPDTKSLGGSPCNNYQGFCDVFQKCKLVDPSGPLSNLKKILLSGETLQTMKEFLTQHWYVGVGGGLGLILITALFVKVCSKSHGPPKKKKAKGNASNSKKKGTKPRNPRNTRVSPDSWM